MTFTTAFKAIATAGAMALMMSTAASAVTLQLHNGGDPGTLDPHKASGDWENRVIGDYIEGLLTENAKAEAIPGQAESWDISEDGTVYTFHLRDGIQWSDGEPVTAGDFVFAFQRLFNPATAADYAYLQFPIKNSEKINSGEITDFNELGVKAIDDKTLEITLEAPTPFFLDALTHYTAYPVPQHLVEKFGDQWTNVSNIVGNGPYLIKEWLPGSYVRSEKNPDYYDAANVKIDEVFYHVLEDQAAALNRYRAGEFDILTDFPADQYQWLQDNMPGQAHVVPFLGVYYYVMNQEEGQVLSDVRIREALSTTVLREVIGPDILGTGELPAYGWVPPGTNNYVAEADAYMPEWASTPYEERVEHAKELMTEAGYGPDKPLTLQLRYNTNDNHQRIAVAIAAMWEPLGVKVELFNAETAVHYDALRAGDFQVGRAGWLLDYSDPSNTLDLLKTGTNQAGTMNWGNNYGRFSNEEFDGLLSQASTELDLDARAKLLAQAEKIAMDDFAAIPIYWYVSKDVVSPKISGFEENAKNIFRTRWLSKSE
ncbi:peptide ABC transporter substrate-binding protein [Devosia sp. Leaf64]|uniref:peptide ABC transporter substrate-binding protein n=1 Tax=Devosia sp. Leaf64 TaxID=1736229 RepID=UPI00071261FB|nr:peptide ABC transporter substrate-binding protein [Devosia sp. Leaf64]KQN77175.1 peptide ABC transporter substrate-binding protein [Devosia sp. Leaf64]